MLSLGPGHAHLYFYLSLDKSKIKGLLHMKLAEPVKLELCRILQHLCDLQLRHRIESIIAFSDDFVGRCQNVSTFHPLFANELFHLL